MYLVLTGAVYDGDGDLTVGEHWEETKDFLWYRRALEVEDDGLRHRLHLQLSGAWSEMDPGEGW